MTFLNRNSERLVRRKKRNIQLEKLHLSMTAEISFSSSLPGLAQYRDQRVKVTLEEEGGGQRVVELRGL